MAEIYVALGSAAAILIALERGYEGSWYPLGTIMHHPADANPAFGYRLLFPVIASLLQRLVPSFTDHNCFIAIQSVIIAITVYLSGEWATLFTPRLGRFFGYMLLPLMVCPTINYWTFYDIAIIAFWTGCFLLLYYRKFSLYLLTLGLATLNHENILLIIPCAFVYCWDRMKPSRLILFTAAQVAVWFAVRYSVISAVKGAALFDNRLLYNLFFWKNYSAHALIFACIALFPWWLVAIHGWKYASPLLRCSALSLPGLLLVTILFGRFDEARQFAAFVPSCIGLIAGYLGHQYQRSSTPTMHPASSHPFQTEKILS